jgi:hypothetical protein
MSRPLAAVLLVSQVRRLGFAAAMPCSDPPGFVGTGDVIDA